MIPKPAANDDFPRTTSISPNPRSSSIFRWPQSSTDAPGREKLLTERELEEQITPL